MNDTALIENAVSDVLKDYYTGAVLVAAKQAGWCAELWSTLEETGMTRVSIPEESGGAGGSLKEAAAVVRLAGKNCGGKLA